MRERVYVAGVGMIPFAKPGASETYDVMGATAAVEALADAGIAYSDVGQAYVGYVYGRLHRRPEGAVSRRHDGHPHLQREQQLLDRIVGAVPRRARRSKTASSSARSALGFEQMMPGCDQPRSFNDRPTPFDDFNRATDELVGAPDVPLAIRYFGGAGRAHMERYGNEARDVRPHSRQSEPACDEQSAGPLSARGQRRRRARVAGADARRDDEADGVSSDVRRCRGRRRFRSVCPPAPARYDGCHRLRRR
jgi:hypothetical protein